MSIVNDLIDNEDTNSLNSSSINGSNGSSQTLKEKYERLLQEYTKQKNKLNVVKKAYLELNETSKGKEQLIRKTEQEIESLNFRNKQLVTRITILQNEVDKLHQQVNSLQGNGDHTNSRQSVTVTAGMVKSSSVNIIKEELENKINENVMLHTKINDLEVKNSLILSDYEIKLKKLLEDKDSLEENLRKHEISSKKLINELESDKKKFESKVGSLENEIQSLKLEKKNSIEVISYDLNDLYNLYNDNLCCLNKVYTFVEERIRLLGSGNVHQQLSTQIASLIKLSENSQPVNSVNEFIEHFLQLISRNQEFITEYVGSSGDFYQREFNYVLNQNDVKSELNILNSNIRNLMQVLSSHLNEIASLIKDLFSGRKTLVKNDFETIGDFISKFYSNFKQLLNVFNEKLTLEHLKCTETHDLITIDECINSYLNEFHLIIERFKKIFNQNMNTLLKSWNQAISPPSNSSNHNGISTGSDANLTDRMNSLKENEKQLKIDLESIKERWNNDKLLLGKAENEINELKSKLQAVIQQQASKQEAQTSAVQSDVETELIKKPVVEAVDSSSPNVEAMLKSHYENEILDLRYQLFLVDGKATYYYQEVEYLNENIKFIINELNQEKEANSKLASNLNDLNEELETTRQRYEDQIRTMSEHIASMNDRLSEQAEEIEKLNHFIKNISTSSSNSSKNKKSK